MTKQQEMKNTNEKRGPVRNWLIRMVRAFRLEWKIYRAEKNAQYFLERSKSECGCCVVDKRFYAEYKKYADKVFELEMSKFS